MRVVTRLLVVEHDTNTPTLAEGHRNVNLFNSIQKVGTR